MDLLVIRHGQSELGHKQAEVMAGWIKGNYSINKIYSSPLNRAKQTAEYISKITGIEIKFEDDLMEWNNGLIAGLSREEANKKYPEQKKYPHKRIYGQESYIDFRMRSENALSKVIN
jgi:2,3-bisphosphoglycerate-dependent phosphoglycerate mutase